MNIHNAHALIVRPALAYLEEMLGPPASSHAARFLLAIGYQESKFADRIQGKGDEGPARGFWQFEPIAVEDVMTRERTRFMMGRVLMDMALPQNARNVYNTIAYNDALACIVARLNIYNDPLFLPTDEAEAYRAYLRIWRPGAKRPMDWPESWAKASSVSV